MINLLPYDLKKQLKAARANSSLIKYLLVLILALIFLIAIFVTYYFILENSRPAPISVTTNTTQTNQTSNTSEYDQARVQATKISNDLQTAKSIMDRQISYSTLLTEIAKILPSGTIVDKLDLNSESLNNLNLKIYAKTPDASNTIKSTIESSSIFSNYNLKSVKSDTTNPAGYPSTIEISITVNKGALK